MERALEMLSKVRQLAEQGKHTSLVSLLAEQPQEEIEASPTLSLLLGSAHARLGRHGEGERWVNVALTRASERGDRAIEARALNVKGAIALEAGQIDDATKYFMRAADVAKVVGDDETLGLSSNNLGIIKNLRGNPGAAIGSYTIALAAFQRAGLERGAAMIHHNLAISYGNQGKTTEALKEADRAVEKAEQAGDSALAAQALSGRAELRVRAGDVALAHKEVEQAISKHRELEDPVGEAEDLRILALAKATEGAKSEAETLLRNAMNQAENHGRPLLAASAGKDLAYLLRDSGKSDEAIEMARAARAQFSHLGAASDVNKLDELLGEIAGKSG